MTFAGFSSALLCSVVLVVQRCPGGVVYRSTTCKLLNLPFGDPGEHEPIGWEFESLQARQLSKLNQSVSAASPSSGFGAMAASLTALAFGGDELID